RPLSDQEANAQAPAILDHSRALLQGDGDARPAFAGCAESGECEHVISSMPFFPTPLARPRPASPGARLLTRLSAQHELRDRKAAITASTLGGKRRDGGELSRYRR